MSISKRVDLRYSYPPTKEERECNYVIERCESESRSVVSYSLQPHGL